MVLVMWVYIFVTILENIKQLEKLSTSAVKVTKEEALAKQTESI